MQTEQEFIAPSETKSKVKKKPTGNVGKGIEWIKANSIVVIGTIFCVVGLYFMFFSGGSKAKNNDANMQVAAKQIQEDMNKNYNDSQQNDQQPMQQPAQQTETQGQNDIQQADAQMQEYAQKARIVDNSNKQAQAESSEKNLETIWKKKILLLFKNPNDYYFLLDQEIPSLIANNFKQDPNNQNRINSYDARIASISFVKPENNKDFLNIKLVIESAGEEKYQVVKIFPILNYVNLDFYEDCVIKTSSNGDENILVKGDYIFPYMKIENIRRASDGGTIIKLIVTQENFGGENFVYEYKL